MTHVSYPELVNKPIEVVRRVCAGAGIEADGELPGRISEYFTVQRGGGRARPLPELDPMGYDHRSLLAEPPVERYCRKWGIEPERVRLTGA